VLIYFIKYVSVNYIGATVITNFMHLLIWIVIVSGNWKRSSV